MDVYGKCGIPFAPPHPIYCGESRGNPGVENVDGIR
jgi:hypothetical protein